MIYVLFGPPGVGKTYIGGLLARHFEWYFFDADVLYDEELKHMLRNGHYDQKVRDRYIEKLVITIESLLASGKKDIVIAEAFTKEKNRFEFLTHFDEQVKYVMVHANRTIAHNRMVERLLKEDHVVDEYVFDFVWDEFEAPQIPYQVLRNINRTDIEIIEEFAKLNE